MSTKTFTPPTVTPLCWWRVDTAAGSDTPAAITRPGDGGRIMGRLRSDENGRLSAPAFRGPDSVTTLYLKRMTREVGGVPDARYATITLDTGAADVVVSPAVAAPVNQGNLDAALAVRDAALALKVDATTATSTYAPVVRGTRFVVTGDSITAKNSAVTTAGDLLTTDGWAATLSISSLGALPLVANAGHGGYTSTQLLALFDAEVLAKTPKVVGIFMGTNDSLDGSSLPTQTSTNIKAIVAKCRTAGVSPFICTIPPVGTAALGTPAAAVVTTATTGGTLAAATYSYRVAAVNGVGTTLASTAATVDTTGSTSKNTIVAPWVEGATAYKLFGRVGGSELLIATNTATGAASAPWRVFTDTGSVTPSGALPGSDTTAAALSSPARLKVTTVNNWIRQYCAAQGIPCVDMYSILVDPATGTYRTGYTIDGTHPSSTASRRMGSLAWTTLQSWVTPTPPPTCRENADSMNLWPNGCMINGAANVPTGWTSYSSSGSSFSTTQGVVTGFAGQGFTLTVTADDGSYKGWASAVVGGTPWTTGDRILVAARIKTTGCEVSGVAVDFHLRDLTNNVTMTQFDVWGANVDGYWVSSFAAPNTVNVNWRVSLFGGSGAVTIGELTLINLTTGQLITP